MRRQMMGLLGGFVLVTLLAVYFGKVMETAFLFGSLFLLRSQAGGYHFRSFPGKMLFVMGVFGIMLLFEDMYYPDWLLFIVLLFANLMVILLAPATNMDAPALDQEERRIMKNKAMFMTAGMTAFVLAVRENPLVMPVLIALTVEAMSIVKVLVAEFFKEQSGAA